MKINALAVAAAALLGSASAVFAQAGYMAAPPATAFEQARECAAGNCWGSASSAAVPVPSGQQGIPAGIVPPDPKGAVAAPASAAPPAPDAAAKEWARARRMQKVETGLAAVEGGFIGVIAGGFIFGACTPLIGLVGCAAVGAALGVGIYLGLKALGRHFSKS